MIENLQIAAQISLLGMSLVFAAILLLWGVLALLVRLTAERQIEEEVALAEPASTTASPTPFARTALARAAAAAVAVALALQSQETTPEAPANSPSSAVSAWQAVMRATHLNARRPRR
jgi:hypothetical protein